MILIGNKVIKENLSNKLWSKVSGEMGRDGLTGIENGQGTTGYAMRGARTGENEVTR